MAYQELLIGEEVIPVPLEEEVKSSYILYAMSVIVGRALPDVRDGLKPVHRRILYSMYLMGLTPDKPFRKSARVVGDVLGKFHPHGDAAVYEAAVRMAQTFAMRYPLIKGQGNFGSIDGDPPAAMRYTEMKLAPIALELLKDIDKNTVDFRDNFDGSMKEPEVLPASFPVLLAIGSTGIAVGMATSIPPHNLSELIDATVHLINNPNASVKELMQFLKGPDFPTGALIVGREGIKKAYSTGEGRIKIRSKIDIEELKGGKKLIVIKEIPYGIKKVSIIQQIATLVKSKKLEGISDLRDESDKEGIRIVVELRKGVDPKKILARILKHTDAQTSYRIYMLSLVNGEPKLLNLPQMLTQFIEFRREVILRRADFEIKKIEARLHLLKGFMRIIPHMDEVVKIIRSSPSPKEAAQKLTNTFNLDEKQVKAILEMRLQQLTKMEIDKLKKEYEQLQQRLKELKELVSSHSKQNELMVNELLEIKKKFGDKRLTVIVDKDKQDEVTEEETVTDDVVIITSKDYIIRAPIEMNSKIKTTDIKCKLEVKSNQNIVVFDTYGRAYSLPVRKIDMIKKPTDKGWHIRQYLQIPDNAEVVKAFVSGEIEGDIVIVTAKGMIKRLMLDQIPSLRKGIKVMGLEDDDKVAEIVKLPSEEGLLVVFSKLGYVTAFNASSLRPMGRSAKGVKGMTIRDKDEVCSMSYVHGNLEDYLMVIVTSKGYVKAIQASNLKVQNRGGKGSRIYKVDDKSGKIEKGMIVPKSAEVLKVTNSKGQSQSFDMNMLNLAASSQDEKQSIMKLSKDVIIITTDNHIIRTSSENEIEPNDSILAKFKLKVRIREKLVIFDSTGRLYVLPVNAIEVSKTKQPLNKYIELPENAKIIATFTSDILSKDIALITTKGIVKRMVVGKVSMTKKGIRIMQLREDDKLAKVVKIKGKDGTLVVFTKLGYATAFNINDVRNMGRSAMGVKAIDLKENDEVCDMAYVSGNLDDYLTLLISSKGNIKAIQANSIRIQNRGGRGTLVYKPISQDDKLIKGLIISELSGVIKLISNHKKAYEVNLKNKEEKVNISMMEEIVEVYVPNS